MESLENTYGLGESKYHNKRNEMFSVLVWIMNYDWQVRVINRLNYGGFSGVSGASGMMMLDLFMCERKRLKYDGKFVSVLKLQVRSKFIRMWLVSAIFSVVLLFQNVYFWKIKFMAGMVWMLYQCGGACVQTVRCSRLFVFCYSRLNSARGFADINLVTGRTVNLVYAICRFFFW